MLMIILDRGSNLEKLCSKYFPHINKDSFFELGR